MYKMFLLCAISLTMLLKELRDRSILLSDSCFYGSISLLISSTNELGV